MYKRGKNKIQIFTVVPNSHLLHQHFFSLHRVKKDLRKHAAQAPRWLILRLRLAPFSYFCTSEVPQAVHQLQKTRNCRWIRLIIWCFKFSLSLRCLQNTYETPSHSLTAALFQILHHIAPSNWHLDRARSRCITHRHHFTQSWAPADKAIWDFACIISISRFILSRWYTLCLVSYWFWHFNPLLNCRLCELDSWATLCWEYTLFWVIRQGANFSCPLIDTNTGYTSKYLKSVLGSVIHWCNVKMDCKHQWFIITPSTENGGKA